MADPGPLISLAASYENRYGRASRSALAELARQYERIASAVSSAPLSPSNSHATAALKRTAPILAHLLGRISSLKREVPEFLAPRPVTPPAACPETSIESAQALAEQDDTALRLQLERGETPLAEWVRQKTRQDMLAMPEQALRRHLTGLERMHAALREAAIDPLVAGQSRRKTDAEESQLINEIDAALHIGWLLQEEFSETWAHADSEALLLARMTPYERGQYEVRKDNARRRQEFRRKKPEIYSLDAARRRATLTPRNS